MPDPNKLAKLAEIGFKILPCCGLCKHGAFKPGSDWGACTITNYKHAKHVAASKTSSINKAGSCPSFELDERKAADLKKSGFDAFGP